MWNSMQIACLSNFLKNMHTMSNVFNLDQGSLRVSEVYCNFDDALQKELCKRLLHQRFQSYCIRVNFSTAK